MNYDLAVAWRIYPLVSSDPIAYKEDKLKMVSNGILSFQKSVLDLKVKYFFILDGCPKSYNDLIFDLLDADNIEIIQTDSIGNAMTFKKQIEILSTQNDSDNIYFAEDDYFYLPDGFKKCIELLKQNDVDFISLYQHSDTFSNDIHNHSRKIRFFENQFWHSDSSTCLTFLTTKKILLETKEVFLTYVTGNFDVCIWLTITNTFYRNPFSYLNFYFNNKYCFWLLKLTLKNGFQFLFNLRKYNLWVPYPSFATHLEKQFVSVSIDWEKEISDFEK
jgi:hypothetical protein